MKKLITYLTIGFFAPSCSSFRELFPPIQSGGLTEKSSSDGAANWFLTGTRHRFLDANGNIIPHPFFDHDVEINTQEQTISFFVTNPFGAEFRYGFDLVSGQRYRNNEYCPQQDVWRLYRRRHLTTPTFTEGIIPRFLDSLGEPQSVIVFGNEKFYQQLVNPFHPQINHTFLVRVVGALVEQYCENYPCKKEQWKSKLVLVAVDPDDSRYKEIFTMEQLRPLVNWPYTKSFFENRHGRTLIGQKDGGGRPAYRINGEIGEGANALQKIADLGKILSMDNMKLLQHNCLQFYDYIWRTVLKIKIQQKKSLYGKPSPNQTNTAKISSRIIKAQMGTKVLTPKMLETIAAHGDFFSFFIYLHENFSQRINTCSKFVRYTTNRHNLERIWFFAYFNLLFRLDEMGMSYQCEEKGWVFNPPSIDDGKKKYSYFRACTLSQFQASFDRGILTTSGLARSGNSYLRFIEYDTRAGGSFAKFFNWVQYTGKKYACSSDIPENQIEQQDYIFPHDINWEQLELIPSSKTKQNMEIID